eukprot:577856-Hanusia_phi.AAC.2
MVVTVVIEMLIGREYLLQGFSQFLPPACRDCLMERFFSPTKSAKLKSAKHEPDGPEMSSPEKSDGEKQRGKRRGGFDQSSVSALVLPPPLSPIFSSLEPSPPSRNGGVKVLG